MADDNTNEAREIIDSIAAGDISVPMSPDFSPEEHAKLNNRNIVMRSLECTAKGAPYQTLTNNVRVLQLDDNLRGRFGYDRFTLEETVELPVPWDPSGTGRKSIEEHDILNFAMYIEDFGLTNKAKAEDALKIVCHHCEYDSAQEFLESLKYEGQVHRQDALSLFLGVERTDYSLAVAKLAFNGAVMRIMQPGCKYDYIPTLIGAQGIGKSQFAKRMALRLPWHLDKIGDLKDKHSLEVLRAKTVFEMAELSEKKGAKQETLKQWVTSQVDCYRAPYDRRSKDHPRRFTIIATTNEAMFLDDPTGDRRWLPVRCNADKVELDLFDDELCEHWFTQAYAEAMAEYHANGGNLSLVLPAGVAQTASEARDSARIDDPDEGRIAAYMMDNPNAEICTGMVLQNAYYEEGVPVRDTPSANKVAAVLNSFDWVTKGEGKKRFKHYGPARWWMYKV